MNLRHRTGDRRGQKSQGGIASGHGEEVQPRGNRQCWLCWESHEAWEQPGSWLQLWSSRTALQRPLITAINLASHWVHVEAETFDSEEGSCRQGFGSTGRQQFVQSYTLLPIMWQMQYSVTKVAVYKYFLFLFLVWAVRRGGGFRLRNLFISKELKTKFKTNPHPHSSCITHHASFHPPSYSQSPPQQSSPHQQAAGRVSLSFSMKSWSCYDPILNAAFAAENMRCQCLLTPYPHPAARSSESAPDACSLGSLSFISRKSLQLHWLQELLRGTPAGNLPCKSWGMSCPSSVSSSWPCTGVSFFMVSKSISTPPETWNG